MNYISLIWLIIIVLTLVALLTLRWFKNAPAKRRADRRFNEQLANYIYLKYPPRRN